MRRLGVDYVDIFYSHRPTPRRRLTRPWGALAERRALGQGLYAGISSYSPDRTREAEAALRDRGRPLTIHQPSYSMLNRWIEPALLKVLDESGSGAIAFSPLAQNLLTDRYLDGVPPTPGAARGVPRDARLAAVLRPRFHRRR